MASQIAWYPQPTPALPLALSVEVAVVSPPVNVMFPQRP